jgi:hypothetical protein
MAAQAMPGDGMPCGDMPDDGLPLPGAVDDSASCDCCTTHSCDLSACLGTACLSEFTRMAATVPPAAAPAPWLQPRLPEGVIDTPLRPPIA